jgi:osmotically-inducible protein OsmY
MHNQRPISQLRWKKMAVQKASTKPIHRADEEILEEIWQALWQEESIRVMDSQNISVDVERGQVCLAGHVSKSLHQQRIEEIAWSILGAAAVHNHLVSDHDLSLQVAQALGDDERTRSFVLPVCCDHGWVKLGGRVPNRNIQCAAEATAASVPAGRGVILLPDIMGEQADPARDAVQPGIGVRVYGENENEWTVYQVVISPQNRLVTDVIVRVKQASDDRHAWCDYLVPVEALQVVDSGGIFFSHKTNGIRQFPVFKPALYPFAPLTWQPPYPYAVGSVRWPRKAQSGATNAFIATAQGKINLL